MRLGHANDINDFLFRLIVDRVDDGILIASKDQVFYLNTKIKQQLSIGDHFNFPCPLQTIFSNEIFETLKTSILIFNEENDQNILFPIYYNNNTIHAKLECLKIDDQSFKVLITSNETPGKCKIESAINTLHSYFPFLLIETNKTGRINFCNEKIKHTLEYDQNDINNGLSLSEIVATTSKPLIESLFNNFEEFTNTETIELKLKRKSGGQIPVNMFFNPIYTNDNFDGVRCMFFDISENKRIENKYRHNQQRLRKILDLVPHMISLKDITGQILLANKACAEFYNTSPKNIVYENISKLHENTDELCRILLEDMEVIDKKEMQTWENRILTDSNGKEHIYKITKVPYQDTGSKDIFSLGIAEDITLQRLAEIEKDEANEKYRLLVEKGNDGILIIRDNKIVFANKQAAKIIGKTVDTLIGYPINYFIPKDQIQKTLEKYRQNVQNRIADDFYSLKLVKSDSSSIYIEATINTINYQGKKSRMVFVRDVTRRRIAEKQSEKDRNLLEQAQKIAYLGSWEWDIKDNKFYCSEEIDTILDVDQTESCIKSISWLASHIPMPDRTKILRGFLNAAQTGLKYETDFPAITKKGERKIIHSQSMIFKDSSGNPSSLIGTWIDITDRIKIEQMLKEARLKAEESDKLKSAFLANMSHEIRTPMNAVLGFATLLKREELDHETRCEYIDHILQSGEGLIKLINDIVDISKIESNQLQIEKCPVRINDLLEQIYNRYEELLLLKNNMDISLSCETAMPDPNFTIITDPYRLQQILSNLLNNALKFTAKGEIKFGYSIVKSELFFFVQDQGIGVPDTKKMAIFKRFGKLEDPEQINRGGTGLGLSITKSLIDLLGGRIWLDSEYETGARFYFTLPLEIQKHTKKIIRKNKIFELPNDVDLLDKTILIAEDELLNYKLLETLLKKTGAKVLWAKNGVEAVQMAVEHKIDLVFMDIKMPDMDGYEATKQIKRIDPAIPIIAQTAFAFSNERNYILQSGCDLYMTKPINHLELYKALKMFLVK